MVPILLVSALALLYFYVSTFRRMCAVPNMAVFCSSFTSWFPGMLLRYLLLLSSSLSPLCRVFIHILLLLLFVFVVVIVVVNATDFSPGGSSPYTSTEKKNRNKIYINTVQTIQNTVNTSTHIGKQSVTVFCMILSVDLNPTYLLINIICIVCITVTSSHDHVSCGTSVRNSRAVPSLASGVVPVFTL